MKFYTRLFPVLTLLFFSLLTASQAFSQKKPSSFTVSWSFKGIEPGFDHLSKLVVKVDGIQVAESSPAKQSVPGSIDVLIPPGKHLIEVMSWANYQGQWEEHTRNNNYSIDCMYSAMHTIKKKHKLDLLFDLDAGPSSKWK